MTVDMSEPVPAIRLEMPAEFRSGTKPAEFEVVLMRGNPNEKAHLQAMTLAHLVQALAALTDDQRREVIGQALGITGLGGFECDPRDSASLEELRSVIDEELEWHTPEEEEAADYVANIRQTRADIDELDADRRKAAARADRAEQENKRLLSWCGRLGGALAGVQDATRDKFPTPRLDSILAEFAETFADLVEKK